MKDKKFIKYTLIAFAISLLAGATASFAHWVIPKIDPNQYPLQDFLFNITPFVFWMKYVSDILIFASVALMGYYIFPKRKNIFPQVVAAICTMEFLRGILLFLTPLGPPDRPYLYYGDKSFLLNGFFPSGHTAFIFMCYLFIDKKEEPKIKEVFLIFLLVEIISLILSRSHYSIDVAGGLLLTYFVFDIFKKNKWLEIKA